MDITCGIFVLNTKNEILIVKATGNGNWSIPKGHKGKNESNIEAAFREYWEETNVDVKKLFETQKIISYGSKEKSYYRQKKIRKHLVSFCFQLTENVDDLILFCNSFIDDSNIPEVSCIAWQDIDFCLHHLHYTQIECLKEFLEDIKIAGWSGGRGFESLNK